MAALIASSSGITAASSMGENGIGTSGVAMRRMTRIYGEAISEHGVTPPQLYVLSCLYAEDGQKPRDLAEQVNLDTSSLTGLLDRTERAGLLKRHVPQILTS